MRLVRSFLRWLSSVQRKGRDGSCPAEGVRIYERHRNGRGYWWAARGPGGQGNLSEGLPGTVQEAGVEPGGAGGAGAPGAPELARRGEQHGSLSSRSVTKTTEARWSAKPSSCRRWLRGDGQGGAGGPGGSDFLSWRGGATGSVGVFENVYYSSTTPQRTLV